VKKIVIVGVGAIGSHAAQFLRNEGELKLIDFDRVEQKNVLSQFHSKPSVGKNKATSMRDTFNFLYGLRPSVIPYKFTKDNKQELLYGADLVIDCVDNGATRRLIQAGIGVSCLHAGLAADAQFARIMWDNDFAVDDESQEGAPTCEGGEHLAFIATVAAHVALTATVFLRTGKKLNLSILPNGTTVPT
jgi:molybdopterin-synthase adenylyltransferase